MKTTKVWLCAAALLVPALAGCGGSSSATNTSGPIFLVPHSVTTTLPDGLTGTLTEDRSTVSVNGTVTYTMMLTNSTSQPITYLAFFGPGTFPPAEAALTVSDPSGKTVYPLGPMAQVIGFGQPVTLAPGQSVTATQAVSTTKIAGLTVTQGYPSAGSYTASAAFTVVPGTDLNTMQTAITATAGPLIVTAQ